MVLHSEQCRIMQPQENPVQVKTCISSHYSHHNGKLNLVLVEPLSKNSDCDAII